jgi:hypothetical protein
MKNSKIFVYAALALSAFGMQSCLDYDTPGDEFNANQTIVPPVISSGKEKALNALVGQCMKATKGKANPGQLNALLRKRIAG